MRVPLSLLVFAAALALAACGNSSNPGTAIAAAASPAGSAATAIVGKQTFKTYDALIPVMDGPDNTHAATIDTRLYLPDSATAANPQPAVLMTNGFGLSKTATEIVAMADFLARQGYIVLTFTAQGFGASSGCIRLDSFDYDVKNGSQLVDQMLVDPAYQAGGAAVAPRVKRDAKGPVIGVVGGSYGGGFAVNFAAADPRVRAAIPGRTWNSLLYALNPNNLVTAGDPTGFSHQRAAQGVFKQEWTTLFFASGNAEPAQGRGGCPQEKAASGEPTTVAGTACAGFPTAVCQTYATLLATGDADAASVALVRNSSVATRIADLKVPTMLVQGQSDTLFNVNDATASYLSLKAAGTPVAMIWNSGGHGGYNSQPGECEVYDNSTTTGLDQCYLTQRALAWFNRYLRGDTSVDTGPGFAFHRSWVAGDGSGSAFSQYGQAPGFPAQAMQAFTLSGSADLVLDATKAVAGSATVLNPAGGTPASYTESSNFSGPAASPNLARAPSDPTGQIASFTSAPFTRDVVSVGVPRARLNIANSNTRDLVFFAKLWDVDAAGNATLIKRLIAPVRVPAADVGKPVEFNLVGFAHQFKQGHRLRLSIASTDMTSYNAKVADLITITTGGADASTLFLPVDAPL